MTAELIRIDWPEFGMPDVPPPLSLPELEVRLDRVRAEMLKRGLDVLVVYGDREHAANIQWLTGFDPRFEEAILVVDPRDALLMAGNECLPYTAVSPLVAAGHVRVAHCGSLSLMSQPRKGRRLNELLAETVPKGAAAGLTGWKWFEADEVDDPKLALDAPAFLADPLRQIAGSVVNATDLFMHPGHGLRCTVDAVEIARLEFANQMAARALNRMVRSFREGMSDFEAFEAAQVGGLPLGCHATFATGGRAAQGLSGPTGQILRRGSQISFNICHWGSNICRAGWLAETADDLPVPARGYLDEFAFPYVGALSEWFAMMRPGVSGGDVWARIRQLLPYETFAVDLNPGHLIGTDEWISSPISEGSNLPIRSGMAMQCDVIPGHPVYGSTRMEDGYAIADAGLRADLERQFPAVAARCARRADFMRDVIGLDVPETLLPLADTCGVVAPFLLDARQVIALR
jgi:Xaa-Pro aminopeptidase